MEKQKTVGFLLKRVDCNDGVASHCQTIIRGLKALGWRVVLITGPVTYDAGSEDSFQALKDLSEDWIVFDDMKPFLPTWASIRRIKEIVNKYEISVFHAHGYSILMLARILKFFNGLECVATFHLLIEDDNSTFIKSIWRPKIRKYQIYLRAFAPKAFIASSSEIERFLLQDLGFHQNKVRKILMATDTKYFRPPSLEERQRVRKKFGFEEKDLVCTLVGRLNWIKGHDVLIDAVRQMRKAVPEINVKCLFAGSGDREKQIKEYAFASEDDADCFLFAGHMKDMREVYWTSDILVLPSRSEGFGVVVAEAMCCGIVPIRTPGAGSMDQIQEGKTGYVVPFDDPEALSKAIEKLVNKDFRLQMGKQCVEYASSVFDRELMVEKIVELYCECSGMETK
jgi:glycosyltransferase involved in cell wall biosynthesis